MGGQPLEAEYVNLKQALFPSLYELDGSQAAAVGALKFIDKNYKLPDGALSRRVAEFPTIRKDRYQWLKETMKPAIDKADRNSMGKQIRITVSLSTPSAFWLVQGEGLVVTMDKTAIDSELDLLDHQ